MNPVLKNGDAVNRQHWVEFLLASPQGAIYAHPDYLDIVAPGWQGIEVWRDNHLLAIMPILVKRKGGVTYSLQPSFCQYWGLFLEPDSKAANHKHFSHVKKIAKAALEVLPKEIKWFLHGFAPEFDYPHPFHWDGYGLKTRYTYHLELTQGFEAVEKGFETDTRYYIRKAAGAGITVRESQDPKGLLQLVAENAAQGKPLLKPQEFSILKQLAPFLIQGKLGFLLEAVDGEGQLLGAALFGSFAGKTAYLMSAQAPSQKSSGAMTLLLSKAIEKACATDRIFDFEGSMIESIEGFFRGFGGRPVPYLMIEKNQLHLLARWIKKLR
jgi:hypothetical protein